MKKSLYILSIALLCFVVSSCAGTNDWSVALPNNFEVWHINSKDIKIVYTGDATDVKGIPTFIKEFSFNDRYVCTRNVDRIEENNIFAETYYILDTEDKMVYGPYDSISALLTSADKLQFEGPTNWYRTSPEPILKDWKNLELIEKIR